MMSGMRITPSNCSTYLKSYEIHKGLINKVNDKENDLNQIHALFMFYLSVAIFVIKMYIFNS